MGEIKIHDIKPLVEVPDISFYIFYGLIVLGIIVFCIGIFLFYKYLKNKRLNIKKIYLKKLKNVDFTNSKQSAYTITKYGQLLVQSSIEKQLLEDLIIKLEGYKYQKKVPKVDDETKALYNIFVGALDV